MIADDIIIGSGPAGVSAAHALIARGRRVRMIDVGETLEPDADARRRRMAASAPQDWSAADIDAATAPRRQKRNDVMRPYGSDFPVRDTVGFLDSGQSPSIGLKPSFARGGLSNGWGSAVLPYRIEDLGAWPAAAADLAAHYKAVSAFMPVAASRDSLAAHFPMWRVDQSHAYPAGPQGAELLARLEERKSALSARGVLAGRARLAFSGGDCRTCGLCLYGCPYGLIFNASAEVDRLAKSELFAYQPRLRAIRFEEHADGVRLIAEDLDGGGFRSLQSRRLFVAAGVLPTARIVLNSVPDLVSTLTLRDSQHALMPMLHQWTPPADLAGTPQNTLAQAFIAINDEALSPATIHAQIYAYNDLLKSDLQMKFGGLAGILDPLIERVSRRLLVAQLFLHSDHCGRIALRLDGAVGDARLACAASEGAATRALLKRAAAKLARALAPSGVIAMPFQARFGAVGSSFHVGGSLPMSNDPAAGETDIFGRPAGLKRVHIVDASNFPSVPATTITFTVMATAHRIAADAPP